MFIEFIYNVILPILIAMITSSGFWFVIEKRVQRNSLQAELLIGLAHDRIIYLGLSYIKRGYITHDEHENLIRYLYKPYQKLEGNGTAMRIIEEVNKLPIKEKDTIPTVKVKPGRQKKEIVTNV